MSKLKMHQIYFDEEDWKEFRKNYPKPIASFMVRKLMKKHLKELENLEENKRR